MDKLKVSIELPQSIDNAIYNLTDKPTAAIGTTFADIWYLVFGTISYQADKKRIERDYALNQYHEQLDSAISSIPSDKFVEPSIQVTAQALDNSKYCISEKELRDMFVSLISKSMNKDYSHDIHPSFSEILKQMSPLDANIIKTFKDSPTIGYPLCQYQLLKDNGYQLLLDNVFLLYPNTYLPGNSLAISSLSRLGLLEVRYDHQILNEDKYVPFKEHYWFKFLQEKFPNDEVSIQRGLVRLTPLGRSFVTVCVPD